MDKIRMDKSHGRKSSFFACILLVTLSLTAACGSFVFPDPEGLHAMRSNASKDLSVEGSIADQDGYPLEGITVVVSGLFYEENPGNDTRFIRALDTLVTDVDGCYRMARRTVRPAFTDLQVNASDSQGIFAPDSVLIRNAQAGATAPTIYLKKIQ